MTTAIRELRSEDVFEQRTATSALYAFLGSIMI